MLKGMILYTYMWGYIALPNAPLNTARLRFKIIFIFKIVDEMVGEVVIPPSKKLEDLIRLAELCVDLLRQNEEFYAEVGLNCTK